MTIREFLWEAIWAAFLDDNDWIFKNYARTHGVEVGF